MSYKIEPPPKNILAEQYSVPGASISSLARAYDTSNPTVRRWLKDYQIPLKTHRQASQEANALKKKAPPPKEVLEKEYASHSINWLENKYRTGQGTIYEWLDVYGIKRLPSGTKVSTVKSQQRRDRIESFPPVGEVYRDTGYNLNETQKKLGVGRKTLYDIFEHQGIEKRQFVASGEERVLFEWLRESYPSLGWKSNAKDVIPPLELDMYSPVAKIAVEYCGLFWHSEEGSRISNQRNVRGSSYHRHKLNRCRELGISLFTIFSSDDQMKVKALLRRKLSPSQRVGARETFVRTLTAEECRSFENAYHLSGGTDAGVRLGLVHPVSGIVSVMTFSKPRFSKNYEWEIVRYTVGNTIVIGGAEKLFKEFVGTRRPKTVVSYADLRFGTGRVYERLGFEFLHFSDPNYWYWHPKRPFLHHRVQFQKHKLRDRLESFNPSLSEWENMKASGWDRIWDCGNGVYVWKDESP